MKRKVETPEPTPEPAADGASGGKPRRGIAPNVVVADAARVKEAFCQATGAREFFTLEDPETQRLMHGAVMTPGVGGGGHVFFEDISLNPFKDTLQVPFSDYRQGNQSHVILHGNVLNAPELASKMLGSNTLGQKCRELVPVEKQFWGAEFGILQDGCGILWALSTKAEDDMEMSPQPPVVRSCVTVPDVDQYLRFLRESFGDLLVQEEVLKDHSGLQRADLLIMGSGVSVLRGEAAGAEACSVELALPRGKEAAEALGVDGSVSEVDDKTWMVKMACGVNVNIRDPSSLTS